MMLSDRGTSDQGVGKPVDKLDCLCQDYKTCVNAATELYGPDCIPGMVKYKWKINKKGTV